jgi:hypothetical protein
MPSSTALQRRKQMLNLREKVERLVFLLGMVVLALDLFYWRP